MTKKSITTDQAPQAIGAIRKLSFQIICYMFLGKSHLNLQAWKLLIKVLMQAVDQVLNNLEAICKAVNCSLDNIVKLTIYLTDLNNFNTLNAIMEKRFTKPFPARATIEVSALPKGVTVEMDAIVEIP